MEAKIRVYALLVCFFTVASLTVSLSIFTYHSLIFFSPENYLSGYTEREHINNENFENRYLSKYNKNESSTIEKKYTDEEITEKRLQSLAEEILIEKKSAQQTLLKTFIFSFFAFLTFILHWKLVKKTKKK